MIRARLEAATSQRVLPMLSQFRHQTRPLIRISTLVRAAGGLTAAILFCAPAELAHASPADAWGGTGSRTIVATVGSESVSKGDVLAHAKESLDQQDAEFALQMGQLKLKHEQARYDLINQRLEQMLDQKALEMEAKARGTTAAAVEAGITIPAISDEEARAYYDAKKASAPQTFEQLKPQIVQYLGAQRSYDVTRSFLDALRAKYQIVSRMEPYRVAVAATGPARGKGDAAVTIVEFADYQCPYCRQAEATLRTIMNKHANDVRLVFRNLPIPSVHVHATAAALAAVCADQQGKFWPMHDALFADPSALGDDGLRDTAKRVGVDGERFAACMADPRTAAAVDADTRAADQLNLTATPSFFINGRPLIGSVPEAQFESLISDELQRAADRRG
jgi:protein-disulfide isomerase